MRTPSDISWRAATLTATHIRTMNRRGVLGALASRRRGGPFFHNSPARRQRSQDCLRRGETLGKRKPPPHGGGYGSVHQVVSDGVTSQVCVRLHSHLFQNARPIGADGL